ncbi:MULTISPECIES: acetone carboxylase subunit gamma [Paenibacillus]|uniref:Subunit beta of acetophenone carboxylase n=1 Tax=Paenibacillus naphthalenovorans TaxID=162209 RepID=A0A0U2W374_9BACL|nr:MULTISPECIES: acetone carboxylase subunit gamma [Paenibacillus]ALS21957.1 subunit beta of acetophenone carboxylase [Paenibacillus naphthalenovorans]
MRIRITESIDIDLNSEMWCCNRCGIELIDARMNYKEGCLIHARDPKEIFRPLVEGETYTFAPDSDWARLVEFYCPGCGVMFENEMLPPGHPITHDIEIDLDKLKQKHQSNPSTKEGVG